MLCQAPDPGRFFDAHVAPILVKRCLNCHNDQLDDGGISFQNRDSLLKGGAHGPAVMPGKPEASLLIHAIRRQGELKMPPGRQLPKREIAILTQWVARGAEWGKKLRPAR